MYDPPYCVVCGGPFDHLQLLNFADLAEDDRYLKNCAYNSQLLSPAQSAWISYIRIVAKRNENGPMNGKSMSSEPDVYASGDTKWDEYEDWYETIPTKANLDFETDSGNDFTPYEYYFVVHGTCTRLLETFIKHQVAIGSSHRVRTMRDFVVACFSRQAECRDLSSDLLVKGHHGKLPGSWDNGLSVEHSYLYFGARRFWTDPWDCEPGFEYLCADPLSQSQSEAWTFISTALAHPRPDREESCSSSSSSVKLQMKDSKTGITLEALPREIIDMIINDLFLPDALNLCASSRKLLSVTDSNFWHSITARLHGCWFWELQSQSGRRAEENWKYLLQILTRSHLCHIRQGVNAYWLPTSSTKSELEAGTPGYAEPTLLTLPLGLRNRQRIWLCLEYQGIKAPWEMELDDLPARGARAPKKPRRPKKGSH